MKIREQDMINSISIDLAFKKDVCRENEVKYLLSLTPMVTEKVSEDMAKRSLDQDSVFAICALHSDAVTEGLSKLHSEKSGKRVRVTTEVKC